MKKKMERKRTKDECAFVLHFVCFYALYQWKGGHFLLNLLLRFQFGVIQNVRVFNIFTEKNHMLEIYVQLSIDHQLHSVCLVFCFDIFETNKRKETSIDIQTAISDFLHCNYYLLLLNATIAEIMKLPSIEQVSSKISFLECNITSNNCYCIDM